MASRIWEVHSQSLGGSIRTTFQGDADIDGLVLSEKAYLLAVRDFRPRQLVEMVRSEGPEGAAALSPCWLSIGGVSGADGA